MRARTARSARRMARSSRPPLPGCARSLRRRACDVSRPGADPDQDACLRSCGQRHARAAVRAHLTRPRHRLRHRWQRPRRSIEPDRRAATRTTSVRERAGVFRVATGMSAIDDLPPLREVIKRHELRAKKSLGQNFLLDLNLTARIARAGGPFDGVSVLEVGPGPGGLTRALIAQGARVVAIERDQRAIAALGEIAARYPGRLEVVAGDALAFDPRPHLV